MSTWGVFYNFDFIAQTGVAAPIDVLLASAVIYSPRWRVGSGGFHMGGAVSNPTATSVYLSQMLPITGSVPWVIRVNKMLGTTQPDLYPQRLVTHGVALNAQVQIVNQGDGPGGGQPHGSLRLLGQGLHSGWRRAGFTATVGDDPRPPVRFPVRSKWIPLRP